MSIINIDDFRPSFVITTQDKSAHIVPVSFFIDVAKGKKKITELDGYDEIIKIIVFEWMYQNGIETGNII